MNELRVLLLGEELGTLTETDSGQLSFEYSDSWLRKSEPYGISINMPIRTEAYDDETCRIFFSALLPDDRVRTQLAQVLKISEANDFALLDILGGECAGAVSLLRKPKRQTKNYEAVELDEAKLVEILDLLSTMPLLTKYGIRLSLAGAQKKIALLKKRNKFYVPGSTDITSHIIKPPIDGFKDSVENEFTCMKLAQACGLNLAEVELGRAGELSYLSILRYDRVRKPKLKRVHQEDFCQALGYLPSKKYQKEGGPGIAECLELLDNYSVSPAVDKLQLIDVYIYNFLIGNNDAHAKNFSLLYSGSKIRLAPFYDLLSTELYSGLSQEMAMKFGSKYRAVKIRECDIASQAAEMKISTKFFVSRIKRMQKLIKKNLKSLDNLLGVKERLQAVISKRSSYLDC